MRREPTARWAVALLTLGALWAPVGVVHADTTCVRCHSRLWQRVLHRPQVDLTDSVHGEVGMECPDCHGGRGDEPTVRAHDPDAGFVPRPTPEQIVQICGGCHSDPSQVPEDLPTDQLEKYRESVHFEMLPNNPRVATCARCHGAHDVKHVDDPHSPVNPDNVVDTCASCHSSPRTMAGTGLPTDQEARWRRSVHGRVAYEQPPDRRPTCPACHDAHGARAGTVATAHCGRCHEELWEAYREGPHEEAFRRMGFNACAECHGSHSIQEADPTLIGVTRTAVCRRCHRQGQPMFETIRQLADDTHRAEAAARRALRLVGNEGDERDDIIHARHMLRVSVHSLDAQRVADAASRLEQVSSGVTATVTSGPTFGLSRVQWIVGVVALVALLAAVVMIIRQRRRRS